MSAKMVRKAGSNRRIWARLAWPAIAGFLLTPLCVPAAQAAAAVDSTARIQALLDNPVNGVVNLPSGVFTISPGLQLLQGEKIAGHNTTLKVAASAGDYSSILAGASSGTDLSGLSITGVTFDQNASGDPVTDATKLYHGQPRFVILMVKGAGISITNDKFLNTNNVDTIVTGSATRGITISGNQFTGVSTPWHDLSAVYTSGTGTTITNNTFTSTWNMTAIEVHGDTATITGNKVTGYLRGVNIAASNTTFTGNTIKGALGPVDLWSTSAPGLHNVMVTGNRLNQNLSGWASYLPSVGSAMPAAPANQQVFQDSHSTCPFSQITISGNQK